MKIIDTHVHLDELRDCPQALERAKEAGVKAIIAVGMDILSNKKIMELSAQYPNFVYPTLGLHPWRISVDKIEENLDLIRKEAGRCIALGEIGLDFALETPQDYQVKILEEILSIAHEQKKPVLLHARRAWGKTWEIVKKGKIEKAVFHWYSGPLDILSKILETGYYISATPAVAYSERHRQAISTAPLERILLETDAPQVYQGMASEPKDVQRTLVEVSMVKGLPAEEVAQQTLLNAQEFFEIIFA
ncbi:MAG: TatD family hydrolase [Thermodesulfobacteriota bacterium]